MRPGRIISSVLILLGLLVGTVTPAVHAQAPAITFHVYNAVNMTVPDDSEETILIDGILETDQAGWGAFSVENICEGTGCTSQDIYYKIELQISWSSDWGHDYPTWEVAPIPVYYFGGKDAYLDQVELGYCGGPTGETGGCSYILEGTVPASEISEDPDDPHEMFMLAYGAKFGGLDIEATYSITISTSPILNVQAPCSGQYNIGGEIGSFTIDPTSELGTPIYTLGHSPVAPGDYYVVQVSGAWKNDGIGIDLRRTAIRYGKTGTWFPLGVNPTVECVDVDTYYLQMLSQDGMVYFRVWDTDGNWAANTGQLTLTLFKVAARTRYQSGCELKYNTGAFIEQRTVAANLENGQPMERPWAPWDPNSLGGDTGGGDKLYSRYYMLETLGGPGYTGPGVYTYDADLGPRSSESDLSPDLWYEIRTAPFVVCVVQTDLIGHVRIYFAFDEQISKVDFEEYYYSFRVRDTGSYVNNTGSLAYRLYQASYLQMVTPGSSPGVNGCAQYSKASSPDQTLTIYGNLSQGTLIPDLTPGAIYAVEVTSGPWKDNGANNYTIEITNDNGDIWQDLEDYDNLLCSSSADGSHTIIYFYAAAGQTWRARANDGDSNFVNNSQSIGLSIYAGDTSVNYFPTCEEDYSVTNMNLGEEVRKIPGNSASGSIPIKTTEGYVYSIEITADAKWYEAGTGDGFYLVDISEDNGATWEHLEDYSTLCALQLGDGNRFKVYFKAMSNQYRLRVRDGDSDFNSNTGLVIFQMYSAINTADPPETGPGSPGSTPPPEWVVACNEAYARPDGWINWLSVSIAGITASFPVPRVGEWLEYIRNSITFYFAWCPQHTESLRNMGSAYEDREPLASIRDFMEFLDGIKTIFEGAQATGGDALPDGALDQEPDLFSDTRFINSAGGGDSYKSPSSAGPWDLFTIGGIDTETSVWYGGQLDMAASLGSSNLGVTEAYKAACYSKFETLFGVGTETYCGLMGAWRFTRILTWLLLGIDMALMVWLILIWLPGYFKRMWGLMNGNRGATKDVIGMFK